MASDFDLKCAAACRAAKAVLWDGVTVDAKGAIPTDKFFFMCSALNHTSQPCMGLDKAANAVIKYITGILDQFTYKTTPHGAALRVATVDSWFKRCSGQPNATAKEIQDYRLDWFDRLIEMYEEGVMFPGVGS